MLTLRYLARVKCLPTSLPNQMLYNRPLSTSSFHNSDRKETDTKDDEPAEKDTKKAKALNKLNSLLNTMVGEEYTTSATKALNKQIARPKRPTKPKERTEKLEPLVTTAAKQVAESFGGNVQQTESELLTKLRSTESVAKSSASLSELIVGMKIDRTKKAAEPEGRASQVRRIMDNGGERRERRTDAYRDDNRRRTDDHRSRYTEERRPRTAPIKVDLFKHEALGIFTVKSDGAETRVAATTRPELPTWDTLAERELRLAVTHPPANVFEEMILWTEQGKLWQFPIDNEQGLDAERGVYFADHVFLEALLNPWCPRKGPVRHFMELVCVGLSKNPYLSVQEKREHIAWFQQYFREKQEILQEAGALEPSQATAAA